MNSLRNILTMLKRSIEPAPARRRRPVAYRLTSGDRLEPRAMLSGAAAFVPLTAPIAAAVVSGPQASSSQVSDPNCDAENPNGDHGSHEGEARVGQVVLIAE